MNIPLISLMVTEPLYDGTQDVVTEIPMDARISSTYSFRSEVTQFPVESGAKVTDHVHLQPDVITIEGMVSDSPIVEVPNTLQLRGDAQETASGSRTQEAFDALWTVWNKRLPLTAVTEYMVYDDMVIEQFDIGKSQDRGPGALWFTATLTKITVVQTLVGTLPPEVVARLKRRRAKTRVSQLTKANPLIGELINKYGSQKAAEVALGKVSTVQNEKYSSAAAAKAKGYQAPT